MTSTAARRRPDVLDMYVYGKDHLGRSLNHIFGEGYNIQYLEDTHDLVQLLFPLPEVSRAVPNAPALYEPSYLYMTRDHILREKMLMALDGYLAFYGLMLERRRGAHQVRLRSNGLQGDRSVFYRWMKPDDHNHARITRIIRSLRIFGWQKEAHALYDGFTELNTRMHGGVQYRTLELWRHAAEDPLWRTPNGGVVEWFKKYGHDGIANNDWVLSDMPGARRLDPNLDNQWVDELNLEEEARQ
ncbi:opioid growth factor receptor conserved region-domain-containing protein [Hypoxylon sp. NC1633]|nr:opioid growth factor receptor conserved region-domain-containing protein [Hypoxylon sp. NC1633]